MGYSLEHDIHGLEIGTTFRLEARSGNGETLIIDGKVEAFKRVPVHGIVVKTKEEKGSGFVRNVYPLDEFLKGKCGIADIYHGCGGLTMETAVSGFLKIDLLAERIRNLRRQNPKNPNLDT